MSGSPLGERTELLGAVHFHTRHSDGSGTVAELAAAAGGAGLDFVVLADHDTLGAREAGEEGWHGRVLVAAGAEVTCDDGPHLLTLGGASAAEQCELTAPEALERAHREGGFVLLAHPSGRGLRRWREPLRDWTHWSHPLLAGCEIWSYLQDWADSFRLWRPADYRLENVAGKIKGPPDWLLALWDAQAERRPFAGLGASDNHARRMPFTGIRYFPHEALIGRLTNRVRLPEPLPADGAGAARALFAALAAGRCTFAREELASSKGFDFRAELPDGQVLRSGETAPFEPGTRLVVESPVEAELRVCRRGRTAASSVGRRLEFTPEEPGAYRAEARLARSSVLHEPRTPNPEPQSIPWCFSNHVRLLGPHPAG